MKVSNEGLRFIAKLESCGGEPILHARRSVKLDQNGYEKYEIGFNHASDDMNPVDKDSVITEAEAYEILACDLDEYVEAFNDFIEKHHLHFPQHQFDAIISAMYSGVHCTKTTTSIYISLLRAGTLYFQIKEIKNTDNEYRHYGWLSYEATQRKEKLEKEIIEDVVRELKRWVYVFFGRSKARSNRLKARRAVECDLFAQGKYLD